MTDYVAQPESLDVPPGSYQAEVRAVTAPELRSDGVETVVVFVLTEPKDKKHPQAGMGGRCCRAWFDLDSENSAAREQAADFLSGLLTAAGAVDLESLIGKPVTVHVKRVVRLSDPSKYKSAVVGFDRFNATPPGFHE